MGNNGNKETKPLTNTKHLVISATCDAPRHCYLNPYLPQSLEFVPSFSTFVLVMLLLHLEQNISLTFPIPLLVYIPNSHLPFSWSKVIMLGLNTP